jgi:hypothetical protein
VCVCVCACRWLRQLPALDWARRTHAGGVQVRWRSQGDFRTHPRITGQATTSVLPPQKVSHGSENFVQGKEAYAYYDDTFIRRDFFPWVYWNGFIKVSASSNLLWMGSSDTERESLHCRVLGLDLEGHSHPTLRKRERGSFRNIFIGIEV